MKHVEEKLVSRIEQKVTITCSRCGKFADHDEVSLSDVRNATIELKSGRQLRLLLDPPGRLEVREFTKIEVDSKEGSSFPEGSSTTELHIDTCFSCFTEHALPALLAAGFKPREDDTYR